MVMSEPSIVADVLSCGLARRSCARAAPRHATNTPAIRRRANSLRLCMRPSIHVALLRPFASEERAALRLAHPEVRRQALERFAFAEPDMLAHDRRGFVRRARHERLREIAVPR